MGGFRRETRFAFRPVALVALLGLATGAWVAGCNVFTGADDLEVSGDAAGAGGGTSASNGATGSGVTSGAGGSSTSSNGSGAGTTTSNGSGGSASGAGGGGGMPPATCSPACGANAYCEEATLTCVCDPGFYSQGGNCVPAAVGDPAARTEADVCQRWNDGHVITEADPLIADGTDCDAGMLREGAFVDSLNRINTFRWLGGLGPTTDDDGYNADAQLCANQTAWWTFPANQSAHDPPPSSKCYTATGGATAGQSNLAWGANDPAAAINQYMRDAGASNALSMGHRRWIMNPPLGPVGIGWWEDGGLYGTGHCLRVFGTQGGGPDPSWYAVPNQGFVPIQIANWTWTFHGSIGGIATADVDVLRVGDNTPMPVTVQQLNQGYGDTAVSWVLDGWSPVAGETYRVTVKGLTGGDISYDVKPVACP